MPIGEGEAVTAARAYAEGRNYALWREGSVRTLRVVVEGLDCWRVTADDALRPDQTWMDEEFDGGQSYLVDAFTGECIGTVAFGRYYLFRRGPDGQIR